MSRQPTPSILDDVLTTDASRNTQLYAGNIKRDGGTQMRADLDPATVQEYADAMAEAGGWRNFPPVITYHDGTDNWLADGFHRLAAYLSRFSASGMIPADVRSGTRRDAILHAAGANASHGLRRTSADKRRSVETLLRDEEWAKWSNMEIARRCNVSESFVRSIKKDLGLDTSHETRYIHPKTGEETTMRTENMGAKPGPAVPPIPQPTAREYAAAVQASQPTPERACWAPAEAPIPAGWDDNDEAEYQAVLPTWQQSARQFNSLIELRRITRRRVAERLSIERLDNLRHSLDEQRRVLWLEERRQERSPSAISNQQSPISNQPPATIDVLPPSDAPLPSWADEPDLHELPPVSRTLVPHTAAAIDPRIPAARALITLYREVIATENQYGALTGQFSDWLAPKRELLTMIGHLEHLIAIIEHPEEAVSE